MKPEYRLAVGTGSTFTDVCLVDDATGRLTVAKVPSTLSDSERPAAVTAIRTCGIRSGLAMMS